MVSGEVGTTTTYGTVDTIHTPQNTPESRPHQIPPWHPHRFWPSPSATEDSTLIVWAHPNPDDMDDKMDRLFFQNVLMYVSDVAEEKEKLSVPQAMLMQYVSFAVFFHPLSSSFLPSLPQLKERCVCVCVHL